MKTIDTMSYPYPQLIYPCQSGIMIKQQTGGLACTHHEVEGIILPLPMYEGNLLFFMEALSMLHPGCEGNSLSLEACTNLDMILKRYNFPLDVIREKRGDSTEAWVHVRIMGKGDRWSFIPSSSIVDEKLRFAREIKPGVTRKEVEKIVSGRLIELRELEDFAGEEAILTWENCD